MGQCYRPSISWWYQNDWCFSDVMYEMFIHVLTTYSLIHPAFRLGPVCRGQFGEVLSFLRPTVHTIIKCPRFPGTITVEWFLLCIRSPCHHNSRMRTFDENSCAISITSPRSLFCPRTQHVWWDHREKSRRASTLWDCRGKSHLAGLSPANGT